MIVNCFTLLMKTESLKMFPNKPEANKEIGNLKFRLIDILKECAENTTGHGLPNIVRAKSWPLKIFWTLCFLASCSYCAYTFAAVIEDYLNYPVVSNVETLDELPTAFPTIMFCNLNPFNTDSDLVVDYFIQKTLQRYPVPSGLSPVSKAFYSSMTLKSALASTIDPSAYGYSLDDMLISCTFASSACTADDFEQVYVFDYTNCFKFNSNGSRMIGKRGFTYGLQLELYIGNSSNSNDYLYFLSRGVRFMVYNYTINSPGIADEGYDAEPGKVTNVEIMKLYSDKLGSPYSDCLSDLTPQSSGQTDLMQMMFNDHNQSQYSQIYCQNLCFQLNIIDKCNCFLFAYPLVQASGGPCTADMFSKCVVNVISSLAVDPGECKTGCPVECERYRNELTVSTSQYMTNWYLSYTQNYSEYGQNSSAIYSKLSKISSLEEARADTLMVNFYINLLGYTSVTETPFYTSASLLAIIGGNLGLFIGLSLLSMVEILELFYLIIESIVMFGWYNYRKKPKNNNTIHVTSSELPKVDSPA